MIETRRMFSEENQASDANLAVIIFLLLFKIRKKHVVTHIYKHNTAF